MGLAKEKNRKYHRASDIFPLMSGEEFDNLVNDIRENGLKEPVWIHPDGSIIDGRNRHRACIEAEVIPQFRTWNGQGSLVTFVVSMNLHRRHLTSSQRAAISLEVLPILEMEARERQATSSGGTTPQLVEMFPQAGQGKARGQAAALFQTNAHYVQDAKKLQDQAPDLLEQVKTGSLTIPQAKRELVTRTKTEPPPLEGKYRILYADPPWKYGNAGIIGDDNYGHVQRHYPSMSIAELCGLGDDIRAILEPNAVLFLWVTSPLLRECFAVIDAWGFKYKTSFIWDKIRHNFGHYNSVRHELLLVCTRGSCTPDKIKLFDSVQSIERTSTHSEKPEEFREIIDTLYPFGKRIELFARKSVENWDGWGNELPR